MKLLLVFAIFVFHHEFSWVEGDEHESKMMMAGCEKCKDYKDIKLKTCCPTYPNLDHHEDYKKCMDCKSKAKGEKMCCLSDCMLKNANLVNSTGYLDMELVKTKLDEMTEKNETWTKIIEEAVTDCVTKAPEQLKSWQSKSPNHAPKCDTAINIAIKHCIRRELFFKCPFPTSESKCEELKEFCKECKIFPTMMGKHAAKATTEE